MVEPAHRRRRLVIAALGASVAASLIGNAFLPALLRRSPELLLAVQSSYQQMALASPRIDPVTFVAIAATRRWLGEVVAFLGGRVLGPDVLRWLGRRRGAPVRLPRSLAAPRAPVRDLLTVLLPHPLLAAAFGAGGMRLRRYVLLKAVSSVLTVGLLWVALGAVVGPLERVGALLDANVGVLTVVGGVAAVLWLLRRRATARDTT
jgi:membrane protein DedA with SNARE-associated domain